MAAAREAAIARLRARTGARKKTDDDVASIGMAAAARVQNYAPLAPQSVRDEATIRFSGYLNQSDFGGVRKEGIGEKDVEYVVNHAAAFRNSGAAGLLSPWRRRRAGSIG